MNRTQTIHNLSFAPPHLTYLSARGTIIVGLDRPLSDFKSVKDSSDRYNVFKAADADEYKVAKAKSKDTVGLDSSYIGAGLDTRIGGTDLRSNELRGTVDFTLDLIDPQGSYIFVSIAGLTIQHFLNMLDLKIAMPDLIALSGLAALTFSFAFKEIHIPNQNIPAGLYFIAGIQILKLQFVVELVLSYTHFKLSINSNPILIGVAKIIKEKVIGESKESPHGPSMLVDVQIGTTPIFQLSGYFECPLFGAGISISFSDDSMYFNVSVKIFESIDVSFAVTIAHDSLKFIAQIADEAILHHIGSGFQKLASIFNESAKSSAKVVKSEKNSEALINKFCKSIGIKFEGDLSLQGTKFTVSLTYNERSQTILDFDIQNLPLLFEHEIFTDIKNDFEYAYNKL